MRLRIFLEDRLPVHPNHIKLTPDVQQGMFYGSYSWPWLGDISGIVELPDEQNAELHANGKRVIRIVRDHHGDAGTVPAYSRPRVVSEETLMIMRTPEAIDRASYIETWARRVKTGAAAGALAILAITSFVAFSQEASAAQEAKGCATITEIPQPADI